MGTAVENGHHEGAGEFERAPRVCLIGAGSSGIAAAKALHERGIPFDCFEKSDRIGGNWVFENKNGMSAAYRDLFINTSRPRMEYSDFPMPESYPDFPHHTQIAAYFEEYVDHFGFREHITFETGVERATREPDGMWTVELEGGETRSYDALIVANGHHWNPRWPEPAFPGSETFTGVQMHAHSYIDNSIFAGKWVVVLGMGNSAMDIAVESSYVAASTHLAARQGVWIIPKYVFGKPVDQIRNDPRVPFKIRQRMIQAMIRSYAGPPERYGLPKPGHRFGEAHPTISGRILDRIQHGTIVPKPNIESFEGSQVHFVDGTTVEADAIV
ncbi:MAG TPA: NAD(P)-binding domain-containing protein, partial [Solirubrobacteraceae bacterium]